jgi:hypothetical protein
MQHVEAVMGDARDNAHEGCGPEGRYANYVEVGHNAFEFLFDFGQLYPGESEARFHTRIVMGPAYAGALLDTLQKAIDRYVESYGAIPERDTKGHGDAR